MYAECRAHDTPLLLLYSRVGADRARLRGADLHLPGSFESHYSSLARIRKRALSEAPRSPAAGDGARLSFGLGARLLPGYGRGAEPLRRIFLLPVYRDVSVASLSGSRVFDRGLVLSTAQVPRA